MLHLNLVPYLLPTVVHELLSDLDFTLPIFFSFNTHNLGRLWVITDDFATIPFHLILFSAALVGLAKSIPVHSLTLSLHLFISLPLLFPFIVLCRTVFAKPEDLQMWQNPSCLFLDQDREFIIFSNSCLDPFANLLIGNMVLVRNVQKHSIASQRPTFFSLTICFQSPQFTGIQKYGKTKERISFTFDPKDMLFSHQISFSFVKAAVACAILERI